MKYTTYDPNTGKILELITITNQNMSTEILQGQTYVEGHYDPASYYISQKQPITLPVKPNDNLYYIFDWITMTWKLDLEYNSAVARQQRDELLGLVDRVNPVRYATLTDQQQAELASYRQALLDVPQQMGFPTDVVWPAKPAWL